MNLTSLLTLIICVVNVSSSAIYSKNAPTLVLMSIQFKPDEPLDLDSYYGYDLYIENANGTIHPTTFLNIPRILNVMIYNCNFSSFDLTSLHQMTYLSSLTINNVKGMPVLTNKIMQGFLNLTKLTLYDTDIKFDYDTFKHLNTLTFLSVTKVDVAIMGNSLFTGSKIEELYWTDTGLEKVDKNCFTPLKRLKIINLNNNKLKNLEIDTFRGLKKLQAIYLANNEFIVLNWRVFEHLPSLDYLDVSKNELVEIKEDTVLYYIPTLLNLVINRNSLIPKEYTDTNFDVNLHISYT